jgi:pyruvate,orthophosphate dikinase
MDVPVAKIKQRVKELHEFNPMLGFRACRLGIVYSEISEMQARAGLQAAAEVQKAGIKVKPEVMIPLVGFKRELDPRSPSSTPPPRRSWPRRRSS